MSRRNPVPTVRRHKTRDVAVCDYYDPGSGERRQAVLGPWGTPAVQTAYARLVADLEAGRTQPVGPHFSVAELAERFLGHAGGYYRDAEGKPTSEVASHRLAVECLCSVAGLSPAREFTPPELLRVREAMVSRGWSRTYVNSQVRRVRGVFRWGVEQGLVPGPVWESLRAVRGLGKGRTAAPEGEPVRPVAEADVEATVPFLAPAVAALVRFQLLTGCRPQDACRLRGCDIERTSPVWVYRPASHKGTWRGKAREVYVGPRGQEVVAPWLLRAAEGVVFPSRGGRVWSKWGYRNHVARGVEKANAAGVAVPHWSPLQLRHTAAGVFRERFGLEMCRVLLGHATTSTSEIYAEKPRSAAAEAMGRVG